LHVDITYVRLEADGLARERKRREQDGDWNG
jgi:hypothetical protein